MKGVSRKSFVLVLIAFLCVVMLLTYSCESDLGGNHECGERFCHICSVLSLLEQIRDLLCAAVLAVNFAGALCLFAHRVFCLSKMSLFARTPVCLRVKLLN